jgi:hypothetical protein
MIKRSVICLQSASHNLFTLSFQNGTPSKAYFEAQAKSGILL